MIRIGEKLNGSIPAVAQAIAARDAEAIRRRAVAQAEAGADYLDVCASVAVEAEAETLRWMLSVVQDATDVPICIDSPNPHALVEAMRFCKRPGMLNSVSLEPGKIETVFPAICGTEWKCVALLCDGDGVPDTAEKRAAICREILLHAEKAGEKTEQLFFDPLVVALATDPHALLTFLDTCRAVRALCSEAHISSGLSNISFGLPMRKYINQAFLVLAKGAGMDSAILDPTNEELSGLSAAAETLLCSGDGVLSYIDAYRGRAAAVKAAPAQAVAPLAPPTVQTSPPAEPAEAVPAGVGAVYDAVFRGRARQIGGAVEAALAAGQTPAQVLNGGMIAAMRDLGEQFSRGEVFIPEMLTAARAMKQGVETLKPYLPRGAESASGTVVIGTVAGDQHDIGKNLVAMMLEGAGFRVIDLGANVPVQSFTDAVAQDPAANIVALSALLTTTMPAMRDTVAALRALPGGDALHILVGGAPVTQAFADEIGADAYGADAAAAAEAARRFAAVKKA